MKASLPYLKIMWSMDWSQDQCILRQSIHRVCSADPMGSGARFYYPFQPFLFHSTDFWIEGEWPCLVLQSILGRGRRVLTKEPGTSLPTRFFRSSLVLVQSGEISDRRLYLPKGNGRTLLIRCVTMERLFWTNNTDWYSTINWLSNRDKEKLQIQLPTPGVWDKFIMPAIFPDGDGFVSHNVSHRMIFLWNRRKLFWSGFTHCRLIHRMESIPSKDAAGPDHQFACGGRRTISGIQECSHVDRGSSQCPGRTQAFLQSGLFAVHDRGRDSSGVVQLLYNKQ